MAMDVVLKSETAIYNYLELLGGGSAVTVYTSNPAHKGRTNRLAVLRKEPGTRGDWIPVKKEMRIDLKSFQDGAVSSKTISELLSGDPFLWASVNEK